MPILQITHEDGRVFNVAEQAFTDLYEPFGFKATGVVYGGSLHAYSDESLEEAKAYERANNDPNATAYTLETAANQARAAGQHDRAEDLTKQAVAMHKARNTEGFTTNPPNTDASLGDVPAGVDQSIGVEGEDITPAAGGNTDGVTPSNTGEAASKASAAATTGNEAKASGSGSAPKGKDK